MGEQRFDFTGAVQSWVVPDGVSEIEVELAGAQGGLAAPPQAANGGTAQTAVVGTGSLAPALVAGDLLIASTNERWNGGGAGPTVTPPPGWTFVGQSPTQVDSAGTRSWRTTVWVRTAEAGDSTFTFTSTATSTSINGASYSLVTIRGLRPPPGASFALTGAVTGGRDGPSSATAWSPTVATPPSGQWSLTVCVSSGASGVVTGWSRTTIGSVSVQIAYSAGTYVDLDFSASDASTLPGVFVSFVLDVETDVIPEPGEGGIVKATIPVTPSSTLEVSVGGQPSRGVAGILRVGGWGGAEGGRGGGGAGGGGGSSQLRVGTTVLAVAGAGAGGGHCVGAVPIGDGGDGGGSPAGSGTPWSGPPVGGGGASTTVNGAGGASTAGTNGSDGKTPGAGGAGGYAGSGGGSPGGGGGGGGGYRGGGGGGYGPTNGAGGGGGSSYVIGTAIDVALDATGGHTGDGYIIIRWEALRTGWFLGTPMGGSGWSVT